MWQLSVARRAASGIICTTGKAWVQAVFYRIASYLCYISWTWSLHCGYVRECCVLRRCMANMDESCSICSSRYSFEGLKFFKRKCTLQTSWENISLQKLVWSLKAHLEYLIIEVQIIWNLKGHLIKSSIFYLPFPLYTWSYAYEFTHKHTEPPTQNQTHTETHTHIHTHTLPEC